MRKSFIVLLALVSVSASSQTPDGSYSDYTHCHVEATRITPRVFAFRAYTAGEEGWRPAYKMALDLRIKNEGNRDIAAVSFKINFPHGTIIGRDWNDEPVNIAAGGERTIHYDQFGGLIDLSLRDTEVSVTLTKVRYSDGENSDFNCDLGDSTIPPPFKPVRPTTPSQIYPIGGEVSPPLVLESYEMTTDKIWRGVLPSSPIFKIGRIITLSVVVEVDGSPQDIKVKSDAFGTEINKKAIETLRRWYFAPAMMGDKPVATRVDVSLQVPANDLQ